jgi:glycosyltransferase involved in cell wall biosynthesis
VSTPTSLHPLQSTESRPRFTLEGRFDETSLWRTPLHRRPISVTILTKNSAARLDEVLSALAWCDDIVIVDTGSSDDTELIARQHPNVSLQHLEEPFPGFGVAHQKATALARHDWILSIDSDEVVSSALAAEILALSLDAQTVYAIPFLNYFNGRMITSCGWHRERHVRLFNRTVTNFCGSDVHEKIQTAHLAVHQLRHPIFHFSYETVDDFLRKMRTYSQLFASQHARRKSSGPMKAVARSVWAFAKSYGFQRGFLQGYEGLVISVYKAQTVFWKYLLLHEANQRDA